MGPLEAQVGKVDVQKLIFMASQSRIDEIRPVVEAAMHNRATLTTALSGMLEVGGRGHEWLNRIFKGAKRKTTGFPPLLVLPMECKLVKLKSLHPSAGCV